MILIAVSDRRTRVRWKRVLQKSYPVYEVDTCTALQQYLLERKPRFLLLDLNLTKLDGPKVVRVIQQLSPRTKIIVFTRSPDEKEAISSLMMGARGYCNKNINPALLEKAVKLVKQGELWVERKIVNHLVEELRLLAAQEHIYHSSKQVPPLEDLTSKQREIVQMISTGFSNKEIADKLHLSQKTIKAHLTSIFRKLRNLKVSNRLQLALFVAHQTKALSLQPPSIPSLSVQKTRSDEHLSRIQ